ncbi:Lrp/AsnC family transcriptional regulator [Mucilaginibacter sp. KACC 22063]|uniref:Lrp/AsnC family transcriptional regulator n=1 Tax=Mucilaginibacter sp. KACC 22063 TaxID=3025666 RepID=UPI0023669869|nr:Lrp/AsnC family transcriptional regulator [Mucilaginibacter sp. KACC 22063]WDF56943.1 Lrp/AsnC family transcriptional regulator [Mucilaginibacter sp. KACC 22063]
MNEVLDETDIRILQLLQQNARLTNKEIGEKLNKTATPIYERIKRLQEQGYIKGYIAVLDHKKIGFGMMAFTQVHIRNHSHENLSHFVDDIIKFDEVLECYQMSGEYDYLLKVAIKDLEAYHDFLMNKLFKVVPLGSVQTTFVLKEAKRDAGFPLTLNKKKGK